MSSSLNRGLRTGGVLAVAAWCLVACGGAAPPGGPSSAEPSPTAPTASEPTVSGTTTLTIVVQTQSGKQTWQLTCDPVGGTHPHPDAACAALAAHGATALPAVPKDRMCTQIYGGPEKAAVTGTWDGQAVSSTFSRTNGCETGRWTALEGLLPKPGQ